MSTATAGISVAQRFDRLLANIALTDTQRTDGAAKHGGVRYSLNSHYWGSTSTSANSLLVGSWGKDTQIRPPRDIDVLFKLPWSVYQRFESYGGNKQSSLLQEVKSVLEKSYSRTELKADRHVVVVRFDSYAVEVLPAFELANGQFWICDTADGGRYKTVDPEAERRTVSDSNASCAGNTRDLIRMMKCWQGWCSVPIKSFWLELLAVNFLESWTHRGKTTLYYDWMARDFLQHLVSKANQYVFAPGTYESIHLGDAWKSRAESAQSRAVKACQYEGESKQQAASEECQKIFGTYIP